MPVLPVQGDDVTNTDKEAAFVVIVVQQRTVSFIIYRHCTIAVWSPVPPIVSELLQNPSNSLVFTQYPPVRET